MVTKLLNIFLGVIAIIILLSTLIFGYSNVAKVEYFLLYAVGGLIILESILFVVALFCLRSEKNIKRRGILIVYYSIMFSLLLFSTFLYLFSRDLLLGLFHAS